MNAVDLIPCELQNEKKKNEKKEGGVTIFIATDCTEYKGRYNMLLKQLETGSLRIQTILPGREVSVCVKMIIVLLSQKKNH